MRLPREKIIGDTLSNRLIEFGDGATWQLTQKLSEKAWEGNLDREEPERFPYEAHAVYECTQVEGQQPGKQAIIKARIEVPRNLDPDENPTDRARHALGMRLHWNTKNETEQLQRVTKAGFKMTPKLLSVKVSQQDETLMWEKADGEDKIDRRWWMPGGYVVYILMEKLPAISLTHFSFWELDFAERQEIRDSFRTGLSQLEAHGIFLEDRRIENLMWNDHTKQCYFIDFEDVDYDPDRTPDWGDHVFLDWGLVRSKYDDPQW